MNNYPLTKAAADWVKQIVPFVSTDETRYTITYIHVNQDGMMEATDGHRAARMKPEKSMPEMEPGFYSLVKVKKDWHLVQSQDPGQFPSLDNVFPKSWDYEFTGATMGGKRVPMGASTILANLGRLGTVVNVAYLLDMPAENWSVYVKAGGLSPVYFKTSGIEVVIMPIRFDRDMVPIPVEKPEPKQEKKKGADQAGQEVPALGDLKPPFKRG